MNGTSSGVLSSSGWVVEWNGGTNGAVGRGERLIYNWSEYVAVINSIQCSIDWQTITNLFPRRLPCIHLQNGNGSGDGSGRNNGHPSDNPFYSNIDSMPDIRPRRKSIPLVSELVSKISVSVRCPFDVSLQQHCYTKKILNAT